MAVVIDVVELAGDAKRVVVSALRALKEYEVLGDSPENVVADCHELSFLSYSHPVMVLSVMLVDVLLDSVGAEGAVCVALVTDAVFPEVMLPVQLAAVTTTLIAFPISSDARV